MGQDENGSWACCDKTIFRPQGSGQLSDEGYLAKGDKCYSVKKLTIIGNPFVGTIRHYYERERRGNF
ncbi:MAG: hypothetical protein MRERC_5c085 [Mycoplasmataceae bacterium RC_NB112A]|nr:MAG: hypothetical protein MRERC_5c085 [Mycoplasmataceae bacterium RC_NB112A]